MNNTNAREKNNQTEANQTNQNKASKKTAHFAKIPRKVIRDKEIKAATEYIYSVLVDMANYSTHILEARISSIASVAQKSSRTIQRHIAILVNLGLVVRIMRKDPKAPKLNMPSLFYIRGDDAERYYEAEYDNDTMQKMSRLCDKNVGQEDKRDSLRENLESNLTGEDELSENTRGTHDTDALHAPAIRISTEEPQKQKPPIKAEKYDLSGVPEAMRPIAEYLLMKTNRPALRDSEREILKELDKHHTTARLMKEIERCCELFMREGRDIQQLTFNYIGKILAYQDSRCSATKATSGNASGEISAPKSDSIQDLPDIAAPIMPLKEAEQVIAEYAPAVKEHEGIPAALEELYDKISDTELENEAELIDSLPKNEEGLPDLDKAETNENGSIKIPPITMEQYLRLKFPEAEEEELRTDRVQDKRGLKEALKIDRTCALCRSRDGWCPLTKKRELPRGGRPVVTLRNHRLQVVYTTCIRCKHNKPEDDPELESRIKRSGLSVFQSMQTFSSYTHEGMPEEIVSAKAKAILAAKNGTSLILAGKAGTGKSHLAAAIALEVMRSGSQALFISVPELLNEMRKSYQDHEFFSVRKKFYNAPCLVLDDLGKEKATEKGAEYLYQIIDYRYRNGMQTIITTNATNMNELANSLNASVIEPLVSRIVENGEWVTIRAAKNYRLTKQLKHEQKRIDS